MSLRWRLTLILLLAMLPAAIISLYQAWPTRDDSRGRLGAEARQAAAAAATYRREALDGARRMLIVLSQLATADALPVERCGAILKEVVGRLREYRDLALIDTERGIILCRGGGGNALDLSGSALVRRAREEGRFTVGETIVDPGLGTAALPVALPLLKEGGALRVLVAVAALDWNAWLAAQAPLAERAAVHLLSADGRLLASAPGAADATASLPPEDRLRRALGPPAADRLTARDRSGVERLYALAPVGNGPLVLLYSVPRPDALTAISDRFRENLAGPLVVWGLAVFAAWLGGELLIARSMRQLSAAAAALSRGDLSARLRPAHGPAELRQLGQALATMAERVQEREDRLRASLKEKEVLLKEIHHRVNNNLQTVTSLLNLQSRRVQDPAARRALETAQMRIRALGLVHKHLYEGENLAAVDMTAFINDLCVQLWRIHGVDPARVRPVVEMAPLHLTPDTAIPLGLLIVEVVANALKHAFPLDRTGHVRIALTQDDATATLHIADDGIGRAGPAADAAAADEKLGMTLIRALAVQLRGRLGLEGPPGTAVILQFSRPFGVDWPAQPASGAAPGG